MVYFLSHRAHRDYPWLNLKKGQQICKVVADSLGDLLKWGKRFGLTRPHISRSGIPHFDLWGNRLAFLQMQGIKGGDRRLYRRRFLRKRKS
jgi:hypothetical protein